MTHLSFDFYININDSMYGASLKLWPFTDYAFGIKRAENANDGRRMVMLCLGPIILKVCDINWIVPEELVDD